MTALLGIVLVAYIVGLYVLAFHVRSRIENAEDFIVAGRRLGFPLATATLLGTWFGAGTILASTDEVRHAGLERAALEPFGAGFCLILAGLFFARPLWEMKLLTVSDFFGRTFDRRTELVSAAVLVPSYFGWIAAQLVALAGMLQLFFGLPMEIGIVLAAVVAIGYTLLGGMWSVSLTDAFQIALVAAGLVALGVTTLSILGDGDLGRGLTRLWSETPPEMRRIAPTEDAQAMIDWLGVLAVGALGNVPTQDLMQRVFSSRSSTVASRACLAGGTLYITLGIIPVTMGLASRILFPDLLERAVLPALAQAFLEPVPAVIFCVVLVSAVLSSVDSAILAPASVLSQNVFRYFDGGRWSPLARTRIAVVLVTAGAIVVAFAGESAYTLLEGAYELPLVGLFVTLCLGLFRRVRTPLAGTAAISTGLGLWLVHYGLDWTYFLEPLTASLPIRTPTPVTIALVTLVVYLAVERLSRGRST